MLQDAASCLPGTSPKLQHASDADQLRDRLGLSPCHLLLSGRTYCFNMACCSNRLEANLQNGFAECDGSGTITQSGGNTKEATHAKRWKTYCATGRVKLLDIAESSATI